MSEEEEIRIKVTQRIGEVEQAVESLQTLRKALLQKAYETKQSILSAFINERDSMQCKEVRLLGEVDTLHHSKDDAVVIQLTKLNQVLGCLRNCLQSEHPCGDCLEKYEDIDMVPVMDMSSEFNTASDQLKQAVCSASRTPITSPVQAHAKMRDEDVMQWLVTPTNVHRHTDVPSAWRISDSSSQVATGDSHVTEWLLQHHSSSQSGSSSSPAAAAEMGSIFTGVKQDDSENWLRSNLSWKQATLSDAPTSRRYEAAAVTTLASRDWLLQTNSTAASSHAGNESDDNLSSGTSSSSAVSSSYAVIPSSYASSDSATDYWLRGNTSSDWLSNSQSANRNGSRDRLASLSSLTSEILSIQADAENFAGWPSDTNLGSENGWLLKPCSNAMKSTQNGKISENGNTEWLRSVRIRNTDWLVGGFEENWISVSAGKHSSGSDYDMLMDEEKHDITAEKSENGEWLRGADEDWLINLKQASGKQRHVSKSRDWLMVVNTMSQISRSDDASWLIIKN